jgi:transposase-like protein
MPQVQLPIFPTDSVYITRELAFKNEMGKITYFNGSMPVFSHDEKDIKAFRMITSQFYVNGNASQADIARAFGISIVSIKRSVKLYRSQGIDGFYAPRNTRGAAVLTEPVLAAVQKCLDDGQSISEIAPKFSLKKNTLSKAIQAGRLHAPLKKKSPP